jgi:phosphoadenosine phosphosulfate reductase
MVAADTSAAALNAHFAGSSPMEILEHVVAAKGLGRMALVSSFGTESAVLLHLAAQADPAVEVLFIDTGKHFPETLAYRNTLIEVIGLTNVGDVVPDPEELADRDAKGLRWSYDPDACCALRKVQPLERALSRYDGTITGRKAFQAETRSTLMPFEREGRRWKVNPLASWTKGDIESYFEAHKLPRHPLEREGYLSVGCAPCTSKVLPGEDIRAGRWRQFDKTECGIHIAGKGNQADKDT